jgi:CRISPR-associated protein Csb2
MIMLALEVEYLTGRSVASMPNDRDQAEWPPHPGRLFMALVAAHMERDPADAAERAALLWLEGLPPPEVSAEDADPRDVLEVFVPVNDNFGPDKVPKGGFSAAVVKEKVRVMPERRSKQSRTFPSVTPRSPTVFFAWPEVAPDQLAEHREALERLAANVTCLGHSSSMVRVALRHDPPAARYMPSDEGTLILRVPTPGRLKDLIACYQSQRRPSAGFFCSYAEVGPPKHEAPSLFGSLLTFRLTGPGLPLTATQRLASVIREAVMERCEIDPAPEILSGHATDGAPSRRDHVAYVPMAFVDHRFADGRIRGFAVIIPRSASADERRIVLRALARLEGIWFDQSMEWSIRRADRDEGVKSLDAMDYERPSRSWATVTPMVFDRFPKERDGREAEAIIGRACRRIGLPAPIAVEVSHVSRLRGVPTSPEFRIVPKPGVPVRPYAHVSLLFDRPVRGPVLLGAGRYQGLGLFRATDKQSTRRWEG